MKRRKFIVLSALASLWPWKARGYDVYGPMIRLTGQTVQMPQVSIGWKLLRSDPDPATKERAVVEDSTEAVSKQILFPDVLASLDKEEKLDLFRHIAQWFVDRAIRRRA